ncbi:hypothetical protein K438DRAFT_1830201 [Mycena galopus ATCC 62051]|nr:hypothetical protein K438DRAFT_1830201 [Mycena galopus ATCC 62051]
MPTPRDTADTTRPLVNAKGKDNKRSRQKDKVDEPCRLFSVGKCTWGDRCRYFHESAEGSTVDSASLESPLPGGGSRKDMSSPVNGDSTSKTSSSPRNQKPISQNSGSSQKSCFAWGRKGSCSKGGNCPRRHEQESTDYERRTVERDIDFLARVMEGKLLLSSSAKQNFISGNGKMR